MRGRQNANTLPTARTVKANGSTKSWRVSGGSLPRWSRADWWCSSAGQIASERALIAFLTNHVDGIAAVDLFVLPTITFRLLYCLVILRHERRLWVSFGVTTNPTAEWISRQITEAFPWDSSPR